MGWSGIWLTALRPGERAEEAVARTTEVWIDWGGEDGPAVIADEDQEPTERNEATDAWIARIVALLRGENPGFEIVDEPVDEAGHRQWVTLDDADGPVVATVYGDQVQLEPARGYTHSDGQAGDGFRTMWRYCQLLGAEGCVAHDPDEEELIDLNLTEEDAAATYFWF